MCGMRTCVHCGYSYPRTALCCAECGRSAARTNSTNATPETMVVAKRYKREVARMLRSWALFLNGWIACILLAFVLLLVLTPPISAQRAVTAAPYFYYALYVLSPVLLVVTPTYLSIECLLMLRRTRPGSGSTATGVGHNLRSVSSTIAVAVAGIVLLTAACGVKVLWWTDVGVGFNLTLLAATLVVIGVLTAKVRLKACVLPHSKLRMRRTDRRFLLTSLIVVVLTVGSGLDTIALTLIIPVVVCAFGDVWRDYVILVPPC